MWNKISLKLATKIVAGVVMVGALGYYNFIDKPIASGVEIGDECPDFTVNTYITESSGFSVGGEEFTLSKQKGKIVIVNFWATYCAPCKAEIPEFNQIQETYKEDVVVITLDGEISFSEQGLCDWINKSEETNGWETYSMLFGRYEETENNVYTKLGFSSGALPATMIINREGIIVFTKEGSMHYEDLEKQILPLLKY